MKEAHFMNKEQVYENIKNTLCANGIEIEEISHKEVHTTDDSKQERTAQGWTEGIGSKNLVFHAKGKFYLVVTTAEKEIKARKFKKEFGTKDIRFAYQEELSEHTGCEIGSIPPFGYLNEELPIFVDSQIFTYPYFMFNPAVNTKSIRIKTDDLKKIYQTIKNPVKLFTITEDGIELEEITK
jgi:Ala-tRNA(Pro) deacylase